MVPTSVDDFGYDLSLTKNESFAMTDLNLHHLKLSFVHSDALTEQQSLAYRIEFSEESTAANRDFLTNVEGLRRRPGNPLELALAES